MKFTLGRAVGLATKSLMKLTSLTFKGGDKILSKLIKNEKTKNNINNFNNCVVQKIDDNTNKFAEKTEIITDKTIVVSGKAGGKIGKTIASGLNKTGCNVSEEKFEKIGEVIGKGMVGGIVAAGITTSLIGAGATVGTTGAAATTSGLASLGGGLGMTGGLITTGGIATASVVASVNTEEVKNNDVSLNNEK